MCALLFSSFCLSKERNLSSLISFSLSFSLSRSHSMFSIDQSIISIVTEEEEKKNNNNRRRRKCEEKGMQSSPEERFLLTSQIEFCQQSITVCCLLCLRILNINKSSSVSIGNARWRMDCPHISSSNVNDRLYSIEMIENREIKWLIIENYLIPERRRRGLLYSCSSSAFTSFKLEENRLFEHFLMSPTFLLIVSRTHQWQLNTSSGHFRSLLFLLLFILTRS